jgi:hypothetical protein
MKLIKLSDTHYIICYDSEIKLMDWCILFDDFGRIFSKPQQYTNTENQHLNKNLKKITHSTQPLEEEKELGYGNYLLNKDVIKPLSLSEVEELIYGYSVEKSLNELYTKDENLFSMIDNMSYKIGFSAHKELVKDKLFTVDDMKKALELGLTLIDGNVYNEKHFQKFIQSLLSPTEWEVEFDEQGKLKLI